MPKQIMENFPPPESATTLTDAFAEGFVYLAEHDMLSEFQDSLPPESGSHNA